MIEPSSYSEPMPELSVRSHQRLEGAPGREGLDSVEVSPVAVADILPFRALYRREMNCQIVHDSLHERGFTQAYLIRIAQRVAGYGCILGFGTDPKDIVREFFVLPDYRMTALALFRRLVDVSGSRAIEAQTNDRLLLSMLQRCASSTVRQKVLFHDAFTTRLHIPGTTFRRTTDADRERMAPRPKEEIGEWLLETDGQIVAHGGVLFHYNPPYGDIYMEVDSAFRRRGYGGYLVQELKRTCYEMGRVPAARCDIQHATSRATLERAGMLPCAYLLKGQLDR